MKMKKKLASVLTVIMLACSLPWQAQAAAPIVSNEPHKAPVATPPAVSEAQPVKAVPEPAAVKADTAAKPAVEVKSPKQAKPEKKAKKTAKKKNGSKKQKSTSRMRSDHYLQWHKATFTLTTKDISAVGRISLIAGMKIVKSSRRSRCTYGEPKR